MNCVIQQVRRVAAFGLSDRELLDALVARRDESAFEALVRRHGPMVLAVCRRVLHNLHDAEDAFQATFLVLIRKATSIRQREAIASWLCGVAYRTARKAQVMNAKRHVREREAGVRPRAEEAPPDVDLDALLQALPEKYRGPVVLCELEGRSRKEAAHQLGLPEGTLSSRLATARKLLARRLRRRGGALASTAPLAASVPVLLVATTVKAAGQVLAGREMTGIVSAKVVALTEGVIKAMFATKLKALATALIVLGGLALGTGRLSSLPFGDGPAASAQEQRQRSKDEVERAAADLAVARAALKQAEANLAAAQARVAQAEEVERAARPSDNAETRAVGQELAARFKYRVPFEVGWSETHEGGRIDIKEVWGTRPKIEVGGQYLVRGKYTLPPGQSGALYFYATAGGDWGNATLANLDLQSTMVSKPTGEFTLVHGMSGPGNFHLVLTHPERYSRTFANVYFGTGDNVLKTKP
jgi:RNA polymerase sigma factor (sigma-70 family)